MFCKIATKTIEHACMGKDNNTITYLKSSNKGR